MKGQRGFTIVEVLIAIVVLVVGVLGLVTTAAMVSRMLGRSQRSTAVAAFASRRMERLRPAACISAQRVAGTDTLKRGGTWVAVSRWSFVDLGNSSYRIQVITTSKTIKNRTRTDTLEMGVLCLT